MTDSNKEEMNGRFHERLEERLSPGQSAKELVEQIVRSALEAEFGPAFTHSKGFGKMVSTIADAIVANPDLRRESLSIASTYIGKKVKVTRSLPHPIMQNIKNINNDDKRIGL